MKAWMTWKEQEEDAALTRHEDGVCGDIDAGCPHCTREWEKRCEETAKLARAKMEELRAYLWAIGEIKKVSYNHDDDCLCPDCASFPEGS